MPPHGETLSPEPFRPMTPLYHEQLREITDWYQRQAAMVSVMQLRPTNGVTVESLLTALQKTPDLWAAVATMGIIDFAKAIVGSRRQEPGTPQLLEKRSRLSPVQIRTLESAIVAALEQHSNGLSRRQILQEIDAAVRQQFRSSTARPLLKLRQPLAHLMVENKIHSVGRKRAARYFVGSAPSRKHDS